MGRDDSAGSAACLIAVEEQDGFSEVLFEKVYLPSRERASHQSNNAGYPGLMHFEAVEETHYNDHTLTVMNGTVEIEKEQRRAEAGWKPVFWLSLA